MNLIPQIAKLLCVELNEKFMVKGYGKVKFTFEDISLDSDVIEYGLVVCREDKKTFNNDFRNVLDDIISDSNNVIKLSSQQETPTNILKNMKDSDLIVDCLSRIDICPSAIGLENSACEVARGDFRTSCTSCWKAALEKVCEEEAKEE